MTAGIRLIAAVVFPESASSVETANHVAGPVLLLASVVIVSVNAIATRLHLLTIPSLGWMNLLLLLLLLLLLAIAVLPTIASASTLVIHARAELWSAWLLELGPGGVHSVAACSMLGPGGVHTVAA